MVSGLHKMAYVKIKRNDTARSIEDTLMFGGVVINLTGATVVLVLKSDLGTVVRRTAAVVSASAGTVRYTLVAGDWNTLTAGVWKTEWEVTISGGTVLTIPDDGYHTIEIVPDLS